MLREQLIIPIEFTKEEEKEYANICKKYEKHELIKKEYVEFIKGVLSRSFKTNINITTDICNLYKDVFPMKREEIKTFLENNRLIFPSDEVEYHFGFGDMNIQEDDSFAIRELIAYDKQFEQEKVPVWVGQVLQSPLKTDKYIDSPINIVSTYLTKGKLGVQPIKELSHYKKIVHTTNIGNEAFDMNFDVLYEGKYNIKEFITEELTEQLLKIKKVFPNFCLTIDNNFITCSFKSDEIFINFKEDITEQEALLQKIRKEIGILFTIEQNL